MAKRKGKASYQHARDETQVTMLLPGLPHCEPAAVLLAVIVGRLVIAVVGRHGVVPKMYT